MRILSWLLCLVLCLSGWALCTRAEETPVRKVLYFTRTGGFHHKACEYSIPVFKKMTEASGGFDVTYSDDVEAITPESLKQYDLIIFSNTSGSKEQLGISDVGLEALIASVKGGTAFVGIHAATDMLGDYPPYSEMIGGTFNGHPWHKEVKIDTEDPAHPAASPVPSPWIIKDEIYTFKNYSRDKLHVIMSLDVSHEENKGNRDDRDYAMAWCKPFGKGRVFYTALGHRDDVWDHPDFQEHLMGGIRWTLGHESRTGEGQHPLRIGHPKPDAEWRAILHEGALDFGDEWETSGNPEVTRKHWSLRPGGILTGDSRGSTQESSHLYYIEKKFRNFEYRAEVCINKGGNSGMYFRCSEENFQDGRWRNWPRGYEAQVNNHSGDPRRSGTLYSEPSVRDPMLEKYIGYTVEKDDGNFWFTQHIICIGDHIVIKLNGNVVVDHFDDRYQEGYFAYQMHHEGAIVKYKNIEVRELP